MKVKRIAGILLALALAAVCFGCGEPKYSEVAAEDYAATLASFEGVTTEVADSKNFGYEMDIKLKMTMAGTTSEGKANAKFLFDAEGNMTASYDMDVSAAGMGENVDGKIKAYMADGWMYMEYPAALAEEIGISKVKMPIGTSTGGGINSMPTLDDLLLSMFEADVSDFAKVEISGKEGEDRWLRVTTKEDVEGGGTFTMQVDKDNKFKSMSAKMSMDMTEGFLSMSMDYEITMKRFSGTITAPADLDSYEEYPGQEAVPPSGL